MSRIKILHIFSLIFVVTICRNTFQCSIQQLQSSELNQNTESVQNCFREIISKGQLQQINQLATIKNQNYKNILINVLQEQMQRLKAMHQELILGESTLQPVIKWGQNSSHIFINIKTSHRWDSPPCLNSKKQSVFLNQTLFQYINICIVAQQKITFLLKIDLYKLASINGQTGSNGQLIGFNVNKNGVGIYSAIFQKLQYEVWPYLSKNNVTHQLWGEILERYQDDHRKYQQLWKAINKQRKIKSVKGQLSIVIGFAVTFMFLFI